jgi:ribulose-5-phosphate 4-epimerase/fuculose-1-phosphate aldolase
MQYDDLIILGNELSSFVVGTEGNISRRTQDGFVIKASGKSLQNMTEDSFVCCDINGFSLSPDQKPSMEVSFHAWIYNNSTYKVIAHTHPTNVLKILCTNVALVNQFAYEMLFPDQVVFNGDDVCVVPYATPGKNLTKAMMSVTKERHLLPSLYLLRNHGIICCANSCKQAKIMTEICDKAAEVFIGSTLLGGRNCLSSKNILDIKQHDDEIYRKNIK